MSDQFKCVLCAAEGSFMCERCLEIYCSSVCQKLDWKTHKSICTLMPNLVPINGIENKLTSQINGLKELDVVHSKAADESHVIKTEISSTLTEQFNGQKLQENVSETTLELTPIDNISVDNVASTQYNGEYTPPAPLSTKNIRFDKSPPTHKVSKKPWRYPASYPENTFFKVEIQHVSEEDSSLLWVTNLSHTNELHNILKDINKHIKAASPQCSEREIAVGEIVAVLPPPDFEQIYYRAIVIEEKNPLNEVRVRLIDFGNEYFVKVKDLRAPIPSMKNDPAYALCIRYTNKKPVQIGDEISIKIVGKEENRDVFSIEDDSQTSAPEEKTNLSSFLTVTVVKLLEKKEVIVVAPDEETSGLLGIMSSDMEKNLKKKGSVDFKQGDFVVGKINDTWHRGFLIGSAASQHLIYCSDTASHEIVEQIQCVPLSYRYIPSLSYILDITTSHIEEDLLYGHYFATDTTFRLQKLNELHSYDLYYEEKKLATVTTKKWTDCLSIICSRENYWTPNSGDLVKITYVEEESVVYICKKEKYQFYSDIFKELAEKASDWRLSLGEIVLAPRESYVRCKILKVYGSGSTVSVMDIDSGMCFVVPSNQVKKANEFVKCAPVFTSKVSLKHLKTDKPHPPSNAALARLKSLAEEKKDFTILYHQNNVVELFEAGSMNRSINRELVPLLFEEDAANDDLDMCLLSPTIATALSFLNDFYSSDQLKVIEIPTGRNVEVLILDNSTLDSGVLTVCRNDPALLDQQEQYNQKVVEYCSSLDSSHGYAPRLNEMCFAIFDFDGQWYRASCLEVNVEDFTLLYVDYGNTSNVKKENIRMFNKDFMHPTNANTCSIDGLPQPISTSLSDSIKQMLEIDTVLVVDRILKLDDTQPILEIESLKKMLEGK